MSSDTARQALLARLSPFTVARRPRDWVADCAVFVAAMSEVVWSASEPWRWFDGLPAWWVALDVPVGVLAVVALWWRRRHPLALGFALAPIGGLVLSAGLAAVVGVYTVAAYCRLRWAVAVTMLHMVVAVPYYFIVPLAPSLEFWALFMVMIYGTALAIGAAVRARREVIAGLISSAERDRDDYERRLQQVRVAERQQIAREMHDVLAHRISLVSVHAGALEFRSRHSTDGRDLSDQELADAVSVIRRSAHAALDELHEVLAVLNADTEADRGALGTDRPQITLAGLPDLTDEATLTGQVVRLRVRADQDQLATVDPQVQRTVYRAVQEGLTNARKHTPGAEAAVELSGRPGEELCLVIDNALPVGMSEAEIPGAGVGLTGLSERVRLDGGTLTHGVFDGRFVLTVRIPWRA